MKQLYVWGSNEDNILSSSQVKTVKLPKEVPLTFKDRSYEPISVVSGSQYVIVLAKLRKISQPSSLKVSKDDMQKYFYSRKLGENADLVNKQLREPIRLLRRMMLTELKKHKTLFNMFPTKEMKKNLKSAAKSK